MKKLFVLFALLSLSVAAMAQESSNSESGSYAPYNSIYSTESGSFSIGLMSRIGYGFYFVDTQDYTPKKMGSGEFFLNILQFNLRPAEVFGAELGVDFLVRHFDSADEAFYQNADGIINAGTSVLPSGAQDIKSDYSTFGANFPLTFNGYFGNFKIGVGAELGLQFAGSSEYRYRSGRRNVTVTEDKAKVNTMTYGIIAQASYDFFGLYFKYYPKSMHILPSPSVDQSFFTIGLQLGF